MPAPAPAVPEGVLDRVAEIVVRIPGGGQRDQDSTPGDLAPQQRQAARATIGPLEGPVTPVMVPCTAVTTTSGRHLAGRRRTPRPRSTSPGPHARSMRARPW